ncbi:DUF805 domain-containing protein [Sulfurimonas sp. C5]|uniref:DUF805 domain-containing protein n=1 Tax=Sulfurimonas sp. C5 TaxID=3036947 RepID=UPI002453FC59|nr:DUF805 domain-containing protein [Sulfurimonas sp. C5]MDH4944340.1 DUF805 domain-containing protein [Sulfurimonas sp. C5]
MKGKILFYDAEKLQGVLTDEEGKRYTFTQEDLRGETEVSQGTEVDFLSDDGESAQDIYIIKATAPAEAVAQPQPQVKNPHFTNAPDAEYVPCKTGGLFSWKGCYTRTQWWKVFISLFIVNMIIWVIEGVMVSKGIWAAASLGYDAYNSGMDGVENGLIDMAITRTVMMGLGMIAWFFIAWIAFVSSIKRFHDANMSGWMILIGIIPFVGPLIVFIMNGFVGSKPYGNLYCVEKDPAGRPIVKGSPQEEALNKFKEEQANKPPMFSAKQKKIMGIVALILVVIAAIAYYMTFNISYTVEKTYSDGVKRSSISYKSWYDSQNNGLRDGESKVWYPNGQLKTEEHYSNGARDGSFKVWSDKGVLTSEANYKLNKKDGAFKEFKFDGKPRLEENYKLDKKDGVFKRWDYYGRLVAEENYQNDKKHGVFKYYRDEKLEREENYKDDQKDGVFKKWYVYGDKSTLTEEVNYTAGKKNGSAKYWDSKGVPRSEENYANNERNGVFKQYYSGNLRYLDTYSNGERNGEYKRWSYDGKNLEEQGTYKYNKKDGTFKRWSNGQLTSEENYRDGQRHGEQKYYSNGKIYRLETYNFNRRTGAYKTWYNNGKPKEVGQYSYIGRRTGTWKYYDSRGRVRTSTYR